MSDTYLEIKSYLDNIHTINTHSHQLENDKLINMNLGQLFANSYVGKLDENISWECFEAKTKGKSETSHFRYLVKGIQKVHGIKDPLDENTYNLYNDKIIEAYKNSNHTTDVLEGIGKYEKILVDAYWNPGSFDRASNIYSAVFRVGMFLYGYNDKARDHNGNNPFQAFHWPKLNNMDEYITLMKREIATKKLEGCVAIKIASAYDRDLHFHKTCKENAAKAFNKDTPTNEEIIDFQNYIVYEICHIAQAMNLPIQIHTGLAKLVGTNANSLTPLIADFPQLKFVVFHGSYPWTDDVLGLAYTFSNVFVDLCWLPIISSTRAKTFLNDLLDVCSIHNISWGCDTWVCEESIGALIAVKEVLADVLSSRIESGICDMDDAKAIIHNIFYSNAKALYNL